MDTHSLHVDLLRIDDKQNLSQQLLSPTQVLAPSALFWEEKEWKKVNSLAESRFKHSQLTSLPDSVLTIIFDHLASTRRTAAIGSCSAYLLGCTCRRLNKFYREEYVNRVSFHRADEENPTRCLGMLFRYIMRYPAIQVLHLGHCHWVTDNIVKRVASLLTTQGEARRTNSVSEIDISSTPITDEALRDLVWVCPSLKSLNISQCMLVTDRGFNFVINCVSGSLQELFADRLRISSSVGCRLQELRHLLLLDLTGNVHLHETDFVGLGALTSLTELSLCETRVTDSAAAVMLSPLINLKLLDFSACKVITAEILHSLPSSLIGLKLSETNVLGGRMSMSDYSCLPNLRELRGRMCHNLVGMLDLQYFAPNLEILDLSDCTYLLDFEMASSLSGLHELQVLNFSGSAGLSGLTLRAAMTLQEIVCLDLSFTSIEKSSIVDFQRCAAKESIRVLDICGCEGLGTDGNDFISIQNALPDCYIRGPVRWHQFYPEDEVDPDIDRDCDKSAEEITEMLISGDVPRDEFLFQGISFS